MDEKAAWIERVLGIAMPSATNSDTAEVRDAGADDAIREELRARMREMVIEAKLLPDKAAVPGLIALAQAAAEAAKGTDLVAAEIAVDELEMAVAQARSAANVAAAQTRKGLVKYRKAQIAWNDARAKARAELERFSRAVLADPDIQEDELYDEVVALSGEFTTLLPQFDDELEEIVDRLDGIVAEDARAPLIAELKSKVAEYRALLNEAEGLADLQSLADDEYGGLSFFHALDEALNALQANLT